MINKIIEFSIRNKLIIGLFTIALILYGSYQVTKLSIDAVPDITDNQVQVITAVPSLGAADIERLITFPIEQANNNIPGIKEIRSFSRFGLSLVTIVFTDETDVYWARQQVTERLQLVQSQIPPGIGVPELGPVSTGLGEIYQYVVRPQTGYENKYDATELRTIQDWIVRRQLLSVKGVAEVSSFGGKLKQYEVAVSPAKLQSHNVTITEIFDAVEENNQNTGGAYIEKGPSLLFIRSQGLIENIKDIENIRIKTSTDGVPLFIRDVAEVKTGHAVRYGAMVYNDEGEAAGAVVMMLKGANSSQVIKDVKERITQIQETLPEGIVIEPFLDRTKMVSHAISTVEKNLAEGALIVVFVLVLFLGNFRAGLLAASVIPLSMLFAITLMNFFGVSGNLMSLGALDFGLIVDGAVIIVEAVMHQLHSHRPSGRTKLNQKEMDKVVSTASGRMMNSAIFGQIIILIVYLPIFTLEGIEGKMFRPMAQTVTFALIGAFILSFTYIPMMTSLFLSRKLDHKPNFAERMMDKLGRAYQSKLKLALKHPKIILISALLLFSLSMFTLSRMGGEFIPTLEEGDFAVDTRVLTGSSLNTTIEFTRKAAGILKSRFPEVEKVVTKIGSGEVPTDPMPIEASDMMVILKDKKEWTSAKSFNELAEKMGKSLEDIPGITTGFQFPVQMRFNELMTGARQDVVCKIFGEDLDSLAVYAHKLGSIINSVDGAEDIYIETVTGLPQIVITYNRTALAQYGLSAEEINRIVNTAFAGQSAGLVYEGERRFDLVVRMNSGERKSLEDVQRLLIPAANGVQIPLYQLAEVEIKNGPNQIQREDAKRRIIVGFNIRGKDVQTVVNELQDKVNSGLKLQAGYYITYGGAFENLDAARKRLLIAVPAALILIFLLLYFAFHSIRQGLLIYSAIPLSAIGGIFLLALRGMPFSISAGVGFIALFGVSVLNGIVLVAEFNRLKKEGYGSLHKIVLRGTKTRLRPVLMTASVASLGFLPMALSSGAGAEVQRPLATVVIGGLITAAILTLFVLPILYILFEKGIKPSKKALTILLLGGLFYMQGASAQTPLNLQAAIDTAIKNNPSLKNEQLAAAYQKQLLKTSAAIPKTGLLSEYGQFNSAAKDLRIGLSQDISFPSVYSRRRKLLSEEWKTAELKAVLKGSELKKEVKHTFYGLLYLREKERLLVKTDSIYTEFMKKAALRLSAGESNVLELAATQTAKGEIRLQLNSLKQELELMKARFSLLLNSETTFAPAGALRMDFALKPENKNLSSHPQLQIRQQETHQAQAAIKLEKARLLPDLSLGYFNMSMKSENGNNGPQSLSFHSIQAGLAIPLFGGAQKAKIKASEINLQIAENSYQQEIQVLNSRLQTLFTSFQNHCKAVDYMENTGLKNAELIVQTAGQRFEKGEIDYMEWTFLINRAVNIQNSYLDTVHDLNESIIEIEYLISRD